jgi:uridine kinase
MGPRLIGIAGASCSGKTELARWLGRRLDAPILNLDHYYNDLPDLPFEERARQNFDEPAALDYRLILEHTLALSRGEAIRAPQYDFATHRRETAEEEVTPGGYVILEGLFALYWPEVRARFGLSVYVDTPDEVCLERRLRRDTVERGRTRESVLTQYEATVRPMAFLHVRPTAAHADATVAGTEPLEEIGARVLGVLAR